MISIPVDNTSVNPARSFGVAIFAGGDAIEQLWAFIVFPVVGAILGAALHKALAE
jgi:aquaporin Z